MDRRLFPALFAAFLIGIQTVYAINPPDIITSPQTFVFNGQPVRVSAVYSNGHNYVKLDDMLKALDIDAALDQPHKTIILDKTKPYTGIRPINGSSNHACRVAGGLESLPKPTPPVAEEYNVKYIMTAENEDKIRECRQNESCAGNSVFLIYKSYLYYSAGAFARDNNIDIAYNVGTNAVQMDKTKPWAGVYEKNCWNYFGLGVRSVDAAGNPLCGIGDFGCKLTGEYFAAPDTLTYGVAITAQYEKHPHADVYRVTEYAVSPGFPIKKFILYPSGLQFSFYASAPGAKELKNILAPVLNKNNEWSGEFPRRQRQVFSVVINGAAADGFLEGGGPVNDEPGFYQYIFAKPYRYNEIKTIHIELR